MAYYNKVFLMGNLTNDPDSKQLESGLLATCGIAVNRKWTSKAGEAKEETTFVDFSCFGKAAEILMKYGQKGALVFLDGRLKLDQWQSHDGKQRTKLTVNVDNVQFVNPKKDKPFAPAEPEQAPPADGGDLW